MTVDADSSTTADPDTAFPDAESPQGMTSDGLESLPQIAEELPAGSKFNALTGSSAWRWVRSPKGLFVAILIIALGGLVLPIPLRGRMLATCFDMTHGPLFAGIVASGVLLLTRSGTGSVLRTAVAVWAVALVVGVAGEGLQVLSSRSPSWHDLLANLLGGTAGFLVAVGVRQTARPERIAMFLIATGLLSGTVWKPAMRLIDCLEQKRQFPLLAGCESKAELSRWSTNSAKLRITQMWSTQGKSSLHVTMQPADYPLLQFQWLPKRNWNTYRYLEFDIMVPSPEQSFLTVKIFDEKHRDSWKHADRFHQQISLAAIQQTVRIDLADVRRAPIGREMELDDVSAIEFFLDHPKKPFTFLIDNVRLSD